MRTFLDKFFPIPDFLRMPAVGLDITDEAIYYVELVNTSKGLGVGRFGRKTLELGVITEGVIQDSQKLKDVLTELQHELGMHFARVAISEQLVYSFVLDIPKVPHQEIRAAVEFQIEEHVPAVKRDLIFDYEILSESVRKYRLKVNAIRTQVFESYHNALKDSGLYVMHLEPRPESMLRSFELGEQRNVIFVDVQKTHSTVSIVENGQIVATTSSGFSAGGEGNIATLRDDIMRYYDYWHTPYTEIVGTSKVADEESVKEVEEIKKEGEGENIEDASTEIVDEKNIEEKEGAEDKYAMYPIIITGNKEGLVQSLEKMCQNLGAHMLEVSVWNAPEAAPGDKHHIPQADVGIYSAAIGLAQSDF